MVGGDEHNDIESRSGGAGYDNWTRPPGDKEIWWWNDNVQEVITAMIEARKMRETSEGKRTEIATGRQTRR